jgi:cyanosortase A-associated protein
MNKTDKFRLGLTAALLGSLFLVLGKSILYPNQPNHSVIPFTLPDTIALAGWQLSASHPLSDQLKHQKLVSGKAYQYVDRGVQLKIEVRYLVNTDGDVDHYLQSYLSNLSSDRSSIRQTETGFYKVFIEKHQAHLSACINSQGGSTVTGAQFRQNRNAYDLKIQRVFPWLVGQRNLRDFRCLWTHLSIPIKESPEQSYQTLETAWSAWYSSWQSRFPQE